MGSTLLILIINFTYTNKRRTALLKAGIPVDGRWHFQSVNLVLKQG